MATAAKGQKPRQTRRVGLKPWAKVMVCILLFPFAAVLLPTTLVFVALMAPTWVAYVTDRSPEKHLAVTVGLMNFSGTLPAIIDLWSRGQSHDAAMIMLADVFVWGVAYGAAMGGWMLFAIMPSIVGSYFKMSTESRIKNLAGQQKALIVEWGHIVASGKEMISVDGEVLEPAGEGEEGPVEVAEAEIVGREAG